MARHRTWKVSAQGMPFMRLHAFCIKSMGVSSHPCYCPVVTCLLTFTPVSVSCTLVTRRQLPALDMIYLELLCHYRYRQFLMHCTIIFVVFFSSQICLVTIACCFVFVFWVFSLWFYLHKIHFNSAIVKRDFHQPFFSA